MTTAKASNSEFSMMLHNVREEHLAFNGVLRKFDDDDFSVKYAKARTFLERAVQVLAALVETKMLYKHKIVITSHNRQAYQVQLCKAEFDAIRILSENRWIVLKVSDIESIAVKET